MPPNSPPVPPRESDPDLIDAEGSIRGTEDTTSASRQRSRGLSQRFAAVVRWLHIYSSLFGFAALLFFGATGLTLNHPAWFDSGLQTAREFEGEFPEEWVGTTASGEQSETESPAADPAESLPRLEIVEALRGRHGVRGAVQEFRVDERECLILFRGPGYSADIVVDRETRTYRGTITSLGLVAVINDLHKGRDSGPGWSLVIDVAAVLTVFVSVTGIILILYIRRKRLTGLLTAAVGTIVLIAIYLWLVP